MTTRSGGQKVERLEGWRKVATAVWGLPSDPQIYGSVDVDAGAVLAFIEAANQNGARVTPTHVVGRAVAQALREVPSLNVRLSRGRAIQRESIDVFFITAIKGGRDLSGVKVRHVDAKSAREVARELAERSERLRAGSDRDLARAKQVFERLPGPLARAALRLSAWATGDLALDIPALGLRASPFGSAMVSSVGMLGIPMGFAPIAWMYRVPLLILVGEISERPLVVSGQVQARPVLPLSATIDHRYVDGAEIGRALAALRRYLAAPAEFEREAASDSPAALSGAAPHAVT